MAVFGWFGFEKLTQFYQNWEGVWEEFCFCLLLVPSINGKYMTRMKFETCDCTPPPPPVAEDMDKDIKQNLEKQVS